MIEAWMIRFISDLITKHLIVRRKLKMSSHLTTNAIKIVNILKFLFIGSTEVGKKVAAKAAGNLISTTLELGGKSPTIVDDTANVDVAARRICWGKVRGNLEFGYVYKRTAKIFSVLSN